MLQDKRRAFKISPAAEFTSNFQSCHDEGASLYSLTNMLLTLNVSSTRLDAQAVTLLRHFNKVNLGTKLCIFQDNTS